MAWIEKEDVYAWERALRIATRFLTRLPIPEVAARTPLDEGRSLACYPLVGLALGVLLLLLGAVVNALLPATLAAIVLLVLWLLLTGFLHLDGLADSADALMGGATPEERLQILKDPRTGAAGVVALILVLLLKFAALSALISAGAFGMILWVPFAGRAAVALLVLHTNYARDEGLGANLAEHAKAQTVWLCCGIPALLMLLFHPLTALFALGIGAGVLLLLRWQFQKHFEGVTGDTLGASLELVEASVLCALCAMVLG